jgi:hypothetical protein
MSVAHHVIEPLLCALYMTGTSRRLVFGFVSGLVFGLERCLTGRVQRILSQQMFPAEARVHPRIVLTWEASKISRILSDSNGRSSTRNCGFAGNSNSFLFLSIWGKPPVGETTNRRSLEVNDKSGNFESEWKLSSRNMKCTFSS